MNFAGQSCDNLQSYVVLNMGIVCGFWRVPLSYRRSSSSVVTSQLKFTAVHWRFSWSLQKMTETIHPPFTPITPNPLPFPATSSLPLPHPLYTSSLASTSSPSPSTLTPHLLRSHFSAPHTSPSPANIPRHFRIHPMQITVIVTQERSVIIVSAQKEFLRHNFVSGSSRRPSANLLFSRQARLINSRCPLFSSHNNSAAEETRITTLFKSTRLDNYGWWRWLLPSDVISFNYYI